MKPYSVKASLEKERETEWRIIDLITAHDQSHAEEEMTSRIQSGRYPFVPHTENFKVEPMSRTEQGRLARYTQALRTPNKLPRTEAGLAEFIVRRSLIVQTWCTACYVNPQLIEENLSGVTDTPPVEETSDSGGSEPERSIEDKEVIADQNTHEDALASLMSEGDSSSSRGSSRGTDFDEILG